MAVKRRLVGKISWPEGWQETPVRQKTRIRAYLDFLERNRQANRFYIQSLLGNLQLASEFVQECRLPKGKKYGVFLSRLAGVSLIADRLNQGRRVGNEFASCRLKFVKEGKNRVIYVDEIQGISGRKRDITGFSEEVGINWGAYLLQMVIDNAYYLGFDKVKFIKAEHQEYYRIYREEVKMHRRNAKHAKSKESKRAANQELQEAVKKMNSIHDLYSKIAADAGFKKSEGKYWVVEFP